MGEQVTYCADLNLIEPMRSSYVIYITSNSVSANAGQRNNKLYFKRYINRLLLEWEAAKTDLLNYDNNNFLYILEITVYDKIY